MTEYKLQGWVARDECSGDESNLYIGQQKPKRIFDTAPRLRHMVRLWRVHGIARRHVSTAHLQRRARGSRNHHQDKGGLTYGKETRRIESNIVRG